MLVKQLSCNRLKGNTNMTTLEFYIVDLDCSPILGLQGCQVLDLISRIDSVDKEYVLETVLTEHANVFNGL